MADEESFDPSTVRASGTWIIVDGTGSGFGAEHVRRWRFPGSDGFDTVILFTDHDKADAMVTEMRRDGHAVSACSVGTADELTDLLTTLKEQGVLYVGFDPEGLAFVRHAIDGVIVGIQISE